MSTHVARSHGGDGGNEPPRRPQKIPTSCESSKPKKTRMNGRNINLYRRFDDNKGPLPLEIELTGKQFKFCGDNYQVYIRCVSNSVAEFVPFHYPSWKDVLEKFKNKVYLKVHNYFDIEAFRDAPFWNQMIQGIDSDCASCYRRRKGKLKEHFDTVGGYKDVDFVKRNPPRAQFEKEWGKDIDKLYTNEKWKGKSVQNSENRGKQLYPSSHGSEPYSQKRFKERKATGKVNYIEGWKKSHYKEGRGWCNMRAQQDWVKIENEYKKMLDEVGGDESKVKQLECLARVLGERRGHTRGVGRKVKNVAPYNISAPSTNNVDLNAFSLQLTQQLTQQLSQQFNQQMQQMFMSQNPNNQPPPPHLQFSSILISHRYNFRTDK